KIRAVVDAASTRLRPILMTTAATVMGHFPLVFASGPGAGARNSIGMMLVTGMIIGSAFTLFVVPSIYVLVARTHRAASPALARRANSEERDLMEVPAQRDKAVCSAALQGCPAALMQA